MTRHLTRLRRTSEIFAVIALATTHAVHADSAGATFDINGQNQQVASLADLGTITNTSGVPAIFTLSSNADLSVDNLLTGNLSFIFSGGGNLTLRTPATYTGSTTIDNSILISNIDNALPTTSALTLHNNAVFDLDGHDQTVTALFGDSGFITNTLPDTTPTLTIINVANNSATVALSGDMALTKQGGGTLSLESAPSYTGLTVIDAGTLFIDATDSSIARVAGKGNLTIGSQRSLTSDAIQGPNIHILTAGSLTIRRNGSNDNVSIVNSLLLDGSTNAWNSRLDLTNNKLIIEPLTDRAAALADARDQVRFGKTHNAGIVNSTLQPNQSLVAVDNAIAGFTTFADLPVDPDAILVLTTFTGDANLDGQVTIADLNTVASHWQQFVSDWTQGDFNGDGQVTIADLNALAANFQAGVTPGTRTQSFSEALASIGDFSNAAPSNAPEPASLSLLALAALPLLTRRGKAAISCNASMTKCRPLNHSALSCTNAYEYLN